MRYSFDELENMSEDALMSMSGVAMTGLPRDRYERAYETMLAASDPDVREVMGDVGNVKALTDFDLYVAIRVNGQAIPAPAPERVRIELNNFDDAGDMTGDVSVLEMPVHQVADIIDHANQVAMLRRSGQEMGPALDELEAALLAAGLISEVDETPVPSLK